MHLPAKWTRDFDLDPLLFPYSCSKCQPEQLLIASKESDRSKWRKGTVLWNCLIFFDWDCNGTQSLPVVPGTAGKKGTCMQPIRQILKWVPPDVWLVQLASKLQCNKITAQNVCNLHYPSRCTWEGHDVGKEISKLVCVAVQSLINQRSHKVHRKTPTTNTRCIC